MTTKISNVTFAPYKRWVRDEFVIVFNHYNGDVKELSDVMGISQQRIYKLMKKFNLTVIRKAF